MIHFLFSLLLYVPIHPMQQTTSIHIPTTLPLHQLLITKEKSSWYLSKKLEREYQTINLDKHKHTRLKTLQRTLSISPQQNIAQMLNEYAKMNLRAQRDNKTETIEFMNKAIIAIYRAYIKNSTFDELAKEQKAIAELRVSADIEQNNITPFLDLAEKRINKTIDSNEPFYTMTTIGKALYALYLEVLQP